MTETAANDLNARGPTEPLRNDPAYMLARVGDMAVRHLTPALAPLGLRPVHYAVLVYAESVSGASQREIVEALTVKASTMVGVIDDLERRGLAERRVVPQDRRSYAIFVTEAGSAVLAEARASAAATRDTLLSPLSADECEVLLGLLNRIDSGAPR